MDYFDIIRFRIPTTVTSKHKKKGNQTIALFLKTRVTTRGRHPSLNVAKV